MIDHLQDLADGSPLVLRGLLDAAREDDALVHHGGRWRLQGRLRVGADLNELVASRLETLAADEYEVVEIVAAAEVLDWEVLRTLRGDTDAVVRAEQRGAIQSVSDGSDTLIRLGHPIFREVVRKRCGTARTRQLNTILAQHFSEFLRAQTHHTSIRSDVRSRIKLARFMIRSDIAPDLE